MHLVLAVGENQWRQVPFHLIADDMLVSNLRGVYRIAEGHRHTIAIESRPTGTRPLQLRGLFIYGGFWRERLREVYHGRAEVGRGSGA